MRGSSLVTLALVLLVTYHVVGQDTSALGNTPDVLYYDLPYDNLSFISEDYPVSTYRHSIPPHDELTHVVHPRLPLRLSELP